MDHMDSEYFFISKLLIKYVSFEISCSSSTQQLLTKK